MHELSIATNLVEAVAANLVQYAGAKVESVTLSLGVYAGVDSEALQFCFPLASEGTPVQGALLQIESIPLKIICDKCGPEPLVADSVQCPRCGSTQVTIVSGMEMTLSSMNLTLPDEESSQ